MLASRSADERAHRSADERAHRSADKRVHSSAAAQCGRSWGSGEQHKACYFHGTIPTQDSKWLYQELFVFSSGCSEAA
ncbi:hypothetical protein PBY51_012558 [Eleginops maclovinus]|uniref:Uncharacterized protein n=1 Tax=Eleginops maclovinus TaxID=56733 RepID=A0AAN8AX74_ELEMC|nr:hypothetical protein PBY51_012558 [Eleginops maclovinus]